MCYLGLKQGKNNENLCNKINVRSLGYFITFAVLYQITIVAVLNSHKYFAPIYYDWNRLLTEIDRISSTVKLQRGPITTKLHN